MLLSLPNFALNASQDMLPHNASLTPGADIFKTAAHITWKNITCLVALHCHHYRE